MQDKSKEGKRSSKRPRRSGPEADGRKGKAAGGAAGPTEGPEDSIDSHEVRETAADKDFIDDEGCDVSDPEAQEKLTLRA